MNDKKVMTQKEKIKAEMFIAEIMVQHIHEASDPEDIMELLKDIFADLKGNEEVEKNKALKNFMNYYVSK